MPAEEAAAELVVAVVEMPLVQPIPAAVVVEVMPGIAAANPVLAEVLASSWCAIQLQHSNLLAAL